jgi:ankyrin repeat protein
VFTAACGAALEGADAVEAAKIRATVSSAVKRQNQQLVVTFLQAAADNDKAALDSLLEAGSIEIDDSDYDSRTALHLAASKGHTELVRWLVEDHGAQISARDRYDGTPLDDAIRGRHKDIVEYLAGCAESTNMNSSAYVDMFIQAAADNNIDLMAMLLTAGIDVNCADYDSRTALHLSVCNRSRDATQCLLGTDGIQMSPLDRMGHTPLWDAIIADDMLTAKKLRERGAILQDDIATHACNQAASNKTRFFEFLSELHVSFTCKVRHCSNLV